MNINVKPNEGHDLSLRQATLIGGFSLLLIAVLAPIGYMGIIENIIDTGNPLSTITNLENSSWKFSIGILLLLINAVLDLVGAWALYIIFNHASKSVSLLSAWFRVTYTVVLIIALSNLLEASQLISGFGGLMDINDTYLSTLIMSNINQFYDTWGLGYILFGLHLVLLGYLIINSNNFPLYLGILVCIAGIGYLADHLLILIIPAYNLNLSMYTFAGEVFLLIYLLIRGFKGFSNNDTKQKVGI